MPEGGGIPPTKAKVAQDDLKAAINAVRVAVAALDKAMKALEDADD
jgi:hypothetical protein